MYMTDEQTFLDFSTVRDELIAAQERRGVLTYEQKAALQHAEWAASEMRNGFKTNPEVFSALTVALLELEVLTKYPDLAAKIAELIPKYPDDVRTILASKRIQINDGDIDTILELVRQHVGFE
jgi:DNA-directed RNA polymerase subunit F